MIEKKYRNASSFGDLINKVVGEQGIKTDVAVSIEPATIPILAVTIIVSVTVGILLANLIQKKLAKG